MQYARSYGISDGHKYKYASKEQTCKKDEYPAALHISNACEQKLDGDEDALKALVAKHPVVAGFDTTVDFMYYKSGIFSDPLCSLKIDHAMVIKILF